MDEKSWCQKWDDGNIGGDRRPQLPSKEGNLPLGIGKEDRPRTACRMEPGLREHRNKGAEVLMKSIVPPSDDDGSASGNPLICLVAQAQGWSPEETAIRTALSLEGEAFQVLRNLLPHEQSNWAEIREWTAVRS